MSTSDAEFGSYEHFLVEVAAGRVRVMGMGGGAGSAEVIVGTGCTGAKTFTAHGYVYRGIDNGDVRVHRGVVSLTRPATMTGKTLSPA